MSTVAGISTGADAIRDQYLKLLMAQLKYQNPMEPLDNEGMANQLAQLSQLEQTQNMNSMFQKVLLAEQMGQAGSLIGKNVSFQGDDGSGRAMRLVRTEDGIEFVPASQGYSGTVDGVELLDGQVYLRVGNHLVEFEGIQTIED